MFENRLKFSFANIIVLILALSFLLTALGRGEFLYKYFALSRNGFRHMYFWQIVTYPFLIGRQLSVFHIFMFFFKAMIIFMCLDGIAEKWGKFHTVFFTVAPVILYGIASLIAGQTIAGGGVFVSMLLFVYGFLYPEAKIMLYFILPVPTKIIGAFAVGIAFLSAIAGMAGIFGQPISDLLRLKLVFFYLSPFIIFAFYLRKLFPGRPKHAVRYEKQQKENQKIESSVIDHLLVQRNEAALADAAAALTPLVKKNEFINKIEDKVSDEMLARICDREDFLADRDFCMKCDLFFACLKREMENDAAAILNDQK